MTSRNSRFFVTPVDAKGHQRRYHYLDVLPPAGVPQKCVLVLLHGFPDAHCSWSRVTAPLSMSGYRLIVPDCLGCGLTSKPPYPERLEEYSMKNMVTDLVDLLDHAQAGKGAAYGSSTVDPNTGAGGKVVVVGHDWGSALAWAFAQFRIDRLLGVGGIAVPYPVPTSKFVDMPDLVKRLPNFGYQAFFNDPASTNLIEQNLHRFLPLIFSAPGMFSLPNKNDPHAPIMNEEWVRLGQLEKQLKSSKDLPPSGGRLLSDEEMEYRMKLFKSGGMEGPLNWYRTRKFNHENQQTLKEKGLPATLPALFIGSDLDAALPPAMAKGMMNFVPSVRIEFVKNCGHWIQLEAPSTVELAIRRWIESDVFKQADAGNGVIGWIKSKI